MRTTTFSNPRAYPQSLGLISSYQSTPTRSHQMNATKTKPVANSQSARKKALASPVMSQEELLEQTVEASAAVPDEQKLHPMEVVHSNGKVDELPALSLIWLNPRFLQGDL